MVLKNTLLPLSWSLNHCHANPFSNSSLQVLLRAIRVYKWKRRKQEPKNVGHVNSVSATQVVRGFFSWTMNFRGPVWNPAIFLIFMKNLYLSNEISAFQICHGAAPEHARTGGRSGRGTAGALLIRTSRDVQTDLLDYIFHLFCPSLLFWILIACCPARGHAAFCWKWHLCSSPDGSGGAKKFLMRVYVWHRSKILYNNPHLVSMKQIIWS